MKTLEVDTLTAGLESSIKVIDDQDDQIKQIANDVKEFLSLEEAFQGKGAEAT